MKFGGSSRRRQKMAERDVSTRNSDTAIEQAPPIDTAPISTQPDTTEMSPTKPVYNSNTGQLGTASIGGNSGEVSTTSVGAGVEREPERPGEVSTTAVGVGPDNDEIPTVTNTERDSSDIGADLKIGTTGKVAVAALAGVAALNLFS